MGVYIRGMEMPKEQITAVINPDGLVEILSLDNVLLDEFYAVEVKPHGRLIDADALRAEFPEPSEANGGWRNPDEALVHKTGVWACIDGAPTIIPADTEKEER